MNVKTTWGLGLAVLLVGGLYLWIDLQQDEWLRATEMGEPVFTLRPDHVQQIAFEKDGQRIEVGRVDGMWRIIAPVNTRADAGAMDQLLNTLAGLLRGETITEEERRSAGLTLADYGLTQPRARLEWTVPEGHHVAWVGRTSPLGDAVYMQRQGSSDVVAVPAALLEWWPQEMDALRDRVLFHGDARHVYRVEVRRPGGFLQVQRGEGGVWRIQQPLQARADAIAIRQWLDRIYEWRIQSFVADEVADATAYGLDESAIQLTLWIDGQESGQTILIAPSADDTAETTLARRREGVTVFSIPAEALGLERVQTSEWRDRTFMPIRRRDIGWMVMEDDQHRLRLERDPAGAWSITEPRKWPADPATMSAMLDTWHSTRVESFLEAPPARIATNVVFRLQVGRPSPVNETNAVTFSFVAPPDDASRWWVKRDADTEWLVIPRSAMDGIVTNPLAYRDRRVLSLDPSDVLRIRRTDAWAEHVAQRNTVSGEWTLVSGPTGALRERLLADVIAALSQLDVASFKMEQPQDWSAYGLNPPELVWALGLVAEAGLGRVVWVGKQREDGSRYARTLGEETLFILPTSVARLLEEPLVIQDKPTQLEPDVLVEDAE